MSPPTATLPIAVGGARRLNPQLRPIGKGRGTTAPASEPPSMKSHEDLKS